MIESIGGESTHDFSLAVIRLMLEGKPGTTVTDFGSPPAQARSGEARR